MASSSSHRQMLDPETWATIPRLTASARISEIENRDSGTPTVAGSSHAKALTSMITLGGKDRGPSPAGPLLQPAKAFFEEPLAPLGHDLHGHGQPRRDLLVLPPRSGHQDDPRPNHVSIRRCISSRPAFQREPLVLVQFDGVRAPPRHAPLPSPREACLLVPGKCGMLIQHRTYEPEH